MPKSSISLGSSSKLSTFTSNISESIRAGREYYKAKRESIGPLFGYLVIMSIFIVCQVIVMAVIARKLIISSSTFFRELQDRNWGELVNMINKTSQTIQASSIARIPEEKFLELKQNLDICNMSYYDLQGEIDKDFTRIVANLDNYSNFNKYIVGLLRKLKDMPQRIETIQANISKQANDFKIILDGLAEKLKGTNLLREAFHQTFIGDVLFLIPEEQYNWPEIQPYQRWLSSAYPPIIAGYIQIGPHKEHGHQLNLEMTVGAEESSESDVTISDNETASSQESLVNVIKFNKENLFSKLAPKKLNVKLETISFRKTPKP